MSTSFINSWRRAASLGVVGHHLHAFGDGGGAGREGPGRPGLDVHHADAAGADGFQRRMVAKEGDENPVLFGHFQDGRARFRLNGPAVDGQINHRFVPVLKYQSMFQVMCGDCPTVACHQKLDNGARTPVYLPIHVRQHDVHGADHGDHVRQQSSPAQLVQGAQHHEGRGPDLDPEAAGARRR